MASQPSTQSATTTEIVVPPKRIRAVSIGLAVAIAFSCTTVGFAIGKLSTPPAAASGFPTGGFPGAPGGGFPGAPEGGFPGAPGAP